MCPLPEGDAGSLCLCRGHPELAVVGVAVEDPLEDARTFGAEIDPEYPLAYGDEAFERAYHNFGLPVTYFSTADGAVTEIFNGILTPERLEELCRRCLGR